MPPEQPQPPQAFDPEPRWCIGKRVADASNSTPIVMDRQDKCTVPDGGHNQALCVGMLAMLLTLSWTIR
jgi:hypothetical protein